MPSGISLAEAMRRALVRDLPDTDGLTHVQRSLIRSLGETGELVCGAKPISPYIRDLIALDLLEQKRTTEFGDPVFKLSVEGVRMMHFLGGEMPPGADGFPATEEQWEAAAKAWRQQRRR